MATAVTYAHSRPRRTPNQASAAVASPVAAMKPETAMCRCDDVVVEIVAERADLVSPDVDLLGPDAEFEERAGEVADEEDHRVPDEADTGECHQCRTGAQCGRFGGGRRAMSGRCHDSAS